MCPFLFTAILELSIGPGGSERYKIIHNQKHTKYPKQKRKANQIYNDIFQELLSQQKMLNIMLIFSFKLSDTLEVSVAGMRNDLPMSLPLTKPSHSRNHCMLIQYITTGDSSS